MILTVYLHNAYRNIRPKRDDSAINDKQNVSFSGLIEEENIWLKNLDNKLDLWGMGRMVEFVHSEKEKRAGVKAYLDVIFRANVQVLQEALKMSDGALTFERVVEEAGLTARWEARGEEKKPWK